MKLLSLFPKQYLPVIILLLMGAFAQAQVNVGPIPTLPKGKSIKIVYDAQINSPLVPATTAQVSHQGTVSGSNFSNVLTDDPDGGGTSDATVTAIDVPPFVVSISRKTPLSNAVTNATTVTYLVTFSEGVVGVDASDFSLLATGTAEGTVASVSAAAGTAIDVTVNTITGEGTLRLDVNATGTGITDEGGTALTGGFASGEIYTFDHMVPTLTPVTIASNNANPAYAKVGDKVTLSFTASETIGTPTATILGQAATVSHVSANQWKATYTLLNGDDPEGLVAFSISFSDEAGNAGTAVTAVTTDGGSVSFDKKAPAASAIVRFTPGNETTSATAVTFRITFSEAVTGVDHTDFTLTGTVGGTLGTVSAVAGSGNTRFDLPVSGLSGTGTVGVSLNGSATGIIDAAGNTSGGFTSGETYTRVNAPAVSSISRLAPISQLTNATAVTYQVVFSNSVSGVDADDFSLFSPGNAVSGTIGTVSGSGSTYSVPLTGITGNGDLRLDLKGSGTGIKDDNNTGIEGGYSGGQTYSFDHVDPTLTAVAIGSDNGNPAYAKVGSTVTLTFTADEAIGSPIVTIAGQPAGSITNTSGNTWKASYQMGSGDDQGVVAFSIAYSDGAGNAGAAVTATTNSSSVTFDATAPTVESITRYSPSAELTSAR
jgi:hypothetical protein